MDWLTQGVSEEVFYGWETWIQDWMLVIGLLFFCFELVRYALAKRLTRDLALDATSNFFIFALFVLQLAFVAGFYGSIFYLVEYVVPWSIPTNALTIALCLLLADKAYYWEHRFSHEINLLWATHTVHHSSPHYNISVAYRFGPMDWLVPLPFYIVLVLLGFHPLLVLACEGLVQAYQTLLHTEAVRKFPRPIEYIFNTPSHHRAHHGSDQQYLDKNYGGILIIWDRLFGTFEEERDDQQVTYGLVTPIESNNPLVILFHGYTRLFRRVAQVKGLGNKVGVMWHGPGWKTPQERANEQA